MELFVSLIGQYQRHVQMFVSGLIPFPPDADDVMQETQLVLWREFGTFQPGTNFPAWACTVAYHQVLAWRKRRQRDRLVLSEEFLSAVAREFIDDAERFEERQQCLAKCLNKMPKHHRELIRLRYTEGNTVEMLAKAMNRSTDAVYRLLSRIRHALHDCVNRSAATAGVSA